MEAVGRGAEGCSGSGALIVVAVEFVVCWLNWNFRATAVPRTRKTVRSKNEALRDMYDLLSQLVNCYFGAVRGLKGQISLKLQTAVNV
jgi:hypothetical protein